ncbi:MAG TPA: hypothetical protein VMF69_13220, partial [Gemmataceae bacterium]|nr:hypothetical protein [Gemmataceae bacterium]
MLAANVVESAAAAFMGAAAQFRNDVATSEIALVNAGQPSPTNPAPLTSMANQLNKVENVLAGDWGRIEQAVGQLENAVLGAYQQAFDALLDDVYGYSFDNVPSLLPPISGSGANPSSSTPVATLPVATPSSSGHDPLYVLNLNTGGNVPANVPLNTFSTWSEDLLAQVSGATVSSYSWNVSQAPDLTDVSGANTANLQGTWANFTGAARTDTISVTETPQSGSPITQTMTFEVAGTNSPAYSSSQPTSSSTWPTVITPDQLSRGQATQAAGPYASIGEADGSVQTSFSMPS